jgi:hypothetical protein
MAVAYHLGEARGMEYEFKDFKAKNWRFYQCWLILRKTQKFMPPSPPAADHSEDDEGEGGNENGVMDRELNPADNYGELLTIAADDEEANTIAE